MKKFFDILLKIVLCIVCTPLAIVLGAFVGIVYCLVLMISVPVRAIDDIFYKNNYIE